MKKNILFAILLLIPFLANGSGSKPNSPDGTAVKPEQRDTLFAVTEVRTIAYEDKLVRRNADVEKAAKTGDNYEYSYSAFDDHWDTSQLFAYKDINLKDLPDEIEVKLIDKLDDFHAPVVGKVFSKYGPRGRRNHNGVDIPLKTGDPVSATFPGKVRYARWNSGGFGNLIILRHANGLETWYGHLSKCNVKENDYVQAGDIIGLGGSTGRSRGPHLHFEMRYCDQTFDPEYLVDFAAGDLRYHTFMLERTFFSIYSRASEKLQDGDDFEDNVFGNTSDLNSENILANLEAHEKAEAAKPKPTDPVYHQIRNGDYLGKIARQYGTTVGNICKLNNISANTVIRAGRRLRVR